MEAKVWLAVDEGGYEYKFTEKPYRWHNGIVPIWTSKGKGNRVSLPSGSIQKLIGRELTWEDECVEI